MSTQQLEDNVSCIPSIQPRSLQGWLKALHLLPATRQRLHILKGVSGVVRASRLTLLLGPPGSGRSTLLKALAGRLRSRKLQVRAGPGCHCTAGVFAVLQTLWLTAKRNSLTVSTWKVPVESIYSHGNDWE